MHSKNRNKKNTNAGASASSSPRATEKQLAYIRMLCEERGISEAKLAKRVGIDSLERLKANAQGKRKASILIDALQSGRLHAGWGWRAIVSIPLVLILAAAALYGLRYVVITTAERASSESELMAAVDARQHDLKREFKATALEVARDPLRYMGRQGVVRMTVTRVAVRKKVAFIEQKGVAFTVVIFASDYKNFVDSNSDSESKSEPEPEPESESESESDSTNTAIADISEVLRQFVGKTVEVKGTIELYKGEAEIIVEEPSQIRPVSTG